MSTENKNQTALITGATSGFGWEFCKLFARDGYNVILVAREEERLQKCTLELGDEFPTIKINYFSVDLAQLDAAGVLYDKIDQNNLTVDILVNNAGVGQQGLFVDNELRKEIDIMMLNMVSVMQLTKFFMREMVLRGQGKILQVSSIAGMVPTPRLAVYSATKAFVHFFTDALQEELKGTGVTMTGLYPGASDTEFFERAHGEDTRMYQDAPLYTAKEVAIAGYEGLMEGKKRAVPGLMNKIQAASSTILPDSLLQKAMNKLMEEKE